MELKDFAEFRDGLSLMSFVEWYEGEPPEAALVDVLQIPRNQLTTSARLILGKKGAQYFEPMVSDLTWGIRAYSQFQDILDVEVQDNCPLENRHYGYYKSLVYLRESVITCLNGSVIAALVLLRPFLELSVLHLYWFLRCRSRSYQPYYQWLLGQKHKPPVDDVISGVFNRLPLKGDASEARRKRLQETITSLYSSLCTYSHTPTLSESLTAVSGAPGQLALKNVLHYAYLANLLLKQLTFLYILTYPMMLFPVEGHKKWGFAPPVGMFVDPRTAGIVAKYIGPENAGKLRSQLKGNPGVHRLLDYYDGFPELTPEQLDANWTDIMSKRQEVSEGTKAMNDLKARLSSVKAEMRVMGWFLNYRPSEVGGSDPMTDQQVDAVRRSLENW